MKFFRLFPLLVSLISCFIAHISQANMEYFHQEIPEALLEQVHSIFLEGQEISPALLDFHVDPNVHLFQDAHIELSFIHAKTAYQNSFGYFLYQDLNEDGQISTEEILQKEIVFEEASQQDQGGELSPGDSVNLGKFPAGTRMGFFIIADGFRNPKQTFYTKDELNPDKKRHLALAATADQQQIVLGIEDLPWEQSDHDFNDLVFTFTTDPKSALHEVIADGHLPVAGGEALAPPTNPASDHEIPREPPTGESTRPAWVQTSLEGGGFGCQLREGAYSPKTGLGYWMLGAIGLSRFLRRSRVLTK